MRYRANVYKIKPCIEYKHSLTFRVRRYVVIATKPVHQLQIRQSAQSEATTCRSPIRVRELRVVV